VLFCMLHQRGIALGVEAVKERIEGGPHHIGCRSVTVELFDHRAEHLHPLELQLGGGR